MHKAKNQEKLNLIKKTLNVKKHKPRGWDDDQFYIDIIHEAFLSH